MTVTRRSIIAHCPAREGLTSGTSSRRACLAAPHRPTGAVAIGLPGPAERPVSRFSVGAVVDHLPLLRDGDTATSVRGAEGGGVALAPMPFIVSGVPGGQTRLDSPDTHRSHCDPPPSLFPRSLSLPRHSPPAGRITLCGAEVACSRACGSFGTSRIDCPETLSRNGVFCQLWLPIGASDASQAPSCCACLRPRSHLTFIPQS